MEDSTQLEDLFDVEIDSSAKKFISDIAIWAKITAVSAFISYGLSILVAAFNNPESDGGISAATSRAASISGVLVTVIMGVILNIFLYRFSADSKPAIDNIDQRALESGFNNLKIYFKIIGVLVILLLAFVILALLMTAVGSGM